MASCPGRAELVFGWAGTVSACRELTQGTWVARISKNLWKIGLPENRSELEICMQEIHWECFQECYL